MPVITLWNFRGKFLFEFSQAQSPFPFSWPLWVVFCLGNRPSTSSKPLGPFLQAGLAAVETFYRCEQKSFVWLGEHPGRRDVCEVPVDDARRVLTGAAVVEVLPSVVEVTPGTDSSSSDVVSQVITELWICYEQRPLWSALLLALLKNSSIKFKVGRFL